MKSSIEHKGWISVMSCAIYMSTVALGSNNDKTEWHNDLIEEAWWKKKYTRNNCAPDEHSWKCNPFWMPDSIGSKCFSEQSIILIKIIITREWKREMVIVHF